MERLRFYLVLIVIPVADGAVPGTFFWKPRLGLDLSIPTTELSIHVQLPNAENIKKGTVTLVDGYQAGITVVALAAGISSAEPYPSLDPRRAFFYTNAYRWALRHFSLMPFWLGGNGGSYCDTHKVWRRRFFYMDEFLPKWLRYLFPYVKNEDWVREQKEYKRFKKFSEPAFGKHYRYPNKDFDDFKSQETVETDENLENAASSSLLLD